MERNLGKFWEPVFIIIFLHFNLLSSKKPNSEIAV